MQQTTLQMSSNSSAIPEEGGLIVTLRHLYQGRCDLVIGYPGAPNSEYELRTGDSAIYHSQSGDSYEVRALALGAAKGEFLVTKLPSSPRPALALDGDDPLNANFNDEELKRIGESISSLKEEIARSGKFENGHLDLISRKFDEIQSASRRMGRKDWIQYFSGAVTSICVTATFDPVTAKTLFVAISDTFGWVLGSTPSILMVT